METVEEWKGRGGRWKVGIGGGGVWDADWEGGKLWLKCKINDKSYLNK